MNPWRAALLIGASVVVAAGCSAPDRRISGTATTATAAASPTTSTSAVARPIDDAGLPRLLASPSEISHLVGVGMTPEAIFKKPDTKLRVDPTRCLEAAMPGLDTIQYYGRTGFAGQLLHGDQHAQVIQVVAAFPSEAEAEAFRDLTAQAWRQCQNQQATVTGGRVPLTYALDTVDSVDSVASASMSGTAGDGTRVPCQHSLGSRRNVIIDVRVCAQNLGGKGRDLVAKIAAGL